jgi:hypothetical protein
MLILGMLGGSDRECVEWQAYGHEVECVQYEEES